MRKLCLLFCVLIMLFTSCGKIDSGCTPVSVDSEQSAMTTYCTANNINYSKHSTGLLYEILAQGSGATPNASSMVTVTYTGKLLNGTVFDIVTTPTVLNLGYLIQGWQVALPLIQKGGHIRIVVPSALAYTCTGVGSIPPNSPVFFDIYLIDVQ